MSGVSENIIQSQPLASANPLNMMGQRGRMAARDASPVSEAGDLYGSDIGAKGLSRADNAASALLGRPPRAVDKRKYKYDVLEGKSSGLSFTVTRDDRMSAGEAGDMLERIHNVMGLRGADPGVLHAFDRGLWFCHTVNGASTLNPGRSVWSVPGYTEPFDFSVVRDLLNVNFRRFFRAYADDVTSANKLVLDAYDPNDIMSIEHRGWLIEVAAERGLTRYPYLAHDSADACLELTTSERQALMLSKSMVISSTTNSADRLRATSRVMSADKYDSTVGQSV